MVDTYAKVACSKSRTEILRPTVKLKTALDIAANELSDSGIAEPRREAASLLAFVLTRPKSFLIAHPEYELTPAEEQSLAEVVRRRSSRHPFQYITGRQEFYGLDFEVSPDVLIPRPETEILVEAAIQEMQSISNPRFCEIGVGSGCISVSILWHVKSATAVGTDISDEALGVARRNASKHQVLDRADFLNGDVFDGVNGKFNVIVSNPPYIPAADVPGLQPEVADFEPHSALVGGADGLEIVRRIIAAVPEHLEPGGVLLIEIGSGQAAAVAKLCGPSIWEAPVFLADLQGIQRVLMARVRS